MRRVCSILTAVGLLFSVASPLWAADMGSLQPMQCHREPMQAAISGHSQTHNHHCHEMEDHSVSAPDGTSIQAVNVPKDCPMNCCLQGTPQAGTALAASVYLPLLVVTDCSLLYVAVTFTSPGFSSHTDRGPPRQ
jgi:hypothetical protein